MPTCAISSSCLPWRLSLLGLLFLGWTGSAAAQTLAEPAAWPPECGSSAAFGARLRALVESDTQRSSGAVEITRGAPDDFRLRVVFFDGVREANDRECGPLLDAALVILAMHTAPVEAIAQDDLPAKLATYPQENLPFAQQSEPQPAARPARLDLGEPAPRPRRRAEVALALEGGLGMGILPSVSTPVGAGLHVRRGAFGVSLAARYSPAKQGDGPASVMVDGASMSVLVTYSPRPWLRIGMGLEGYRLRGEAPDLVVAKKARLYTAAFQNEVAVEAVRKGKAFVTLAASLGVSVLRPRFVVEGYGSVHRQAGLTGALGIRAGVELL